MATFEGSYLGDAAKIGPMVYEQGGDAPLYIPRVRGRSEEM